MPTKADRALGKAYLTANTRARSQIIAALVALWRSLGGYRQVDADRFAPAAASLVLGGQQQVSALTAAYLAQQKAALLGVPNRPFNVPLSKVSGKATRYGVDPLDVYRRPVVEVWRQLSLDKTYPQAVDLGEQRLVKIAETDLQLTKTRTASEVIQQDKTAIGYRRVLVGEENCALCTIAATQLYGKAELMPIHPACDCGVGPVYDDEDFDELKQLRAAHDAVKREFGRAAADGRAIDYRKLILTRENSETGPILVVARHKFTAEEDLKARSGRRSTRSADDTRTDTRRANLRSLEQSLPVLKERKANGENVDAAITFQKNRISELRRQLGE
jgi:hypothetical protein